MGLMDVPRGTNKMMTYYSYFLKLQGASFISFPMMVYYVKFGLVWHDAGEPLNAADTNFNLYMNMILTVYAVMGVYIFCASFDPAKSKLFLSFVTCAPGLYPTARATPPVSACIHTCARPHTAVTAASWRMPSSPCSSS